MIRKMFMMGLLMAFLATTTFALAEDVYVTKNGKKYHKSTCEFIKDRNPIKIDDSDAIKKGLKPCTACFKEKINSGKNK